MTYVTVALEFYAAFKKNGPWAVWVTPFQTAFVHSAESELQSSNLKSIVHGNCRNNEVNGCTHGVADIPHCSSPPPVWEASIGTLSKCVGQISAESESQSANPSLEQVLETGRWRLMNTGPKLEEKVPLVLVGRSIDDSKSLRRLVSSYSVGPTKSTGIASYLRLILCCVFCQRPILALFVARR